jgi:hypothetical protein
MSARAAIDEALERFLALPSLAENDLEATLLREAVETLRARPYVSAGLTDEDDERALLLEATASVRLVVLHQYVTPLERDEATTQAALRLVSALESREDELVAGASSGLALRHETLRFLHPRPLERSLDGLPRLLRRWEETPRRRGVFDWLKRKAHQHAQFYRLFFRASAYLERGRRIRAKLPARIVAMPVALETFRAVEQMGPIVDNFVFDGKGKRAADASVAVADYGFLYMQMADEIVDTILHRAGPERTLAFARRLYLEPARRRDFVPLMHLDEDDLRTVDLDFESHDEKYRTTLGEMVLALRDLRALLESELGELEAPLRSAAREELSAFFHHCFSTFLDEIELLRSRPSARLDHLPLGETLYHFYRKNNLVMMRWLGLRALLRGLDPERPAARIRAFGYVLATFQVFDDLKDLAVDLGKQPNYALQIAASSHPHEFARAESRFAARGEALGVGDIPWVNLRMPGTVLACFRLVKLIARAQFSWFEDYVVDLRWRRNWLVRGGNFNRAEARSHLLEEALTGSTRRMPLPELARAVTDELASLHREASHDEILAYAFDVLAFERRFALCLAALPNVHRVYRILNLSMRMSPREKAQVMRKVLKSVPEASPVVAELPRDNPGLGET